MRKVILIALVVFIAVVAGGFGITWYSQASQTKRSIEDAIARINAQQKYITYDSIETSGFPSDVYVSIVNPHFSGRIDGIFKALATQAQPGVNAAPTTTPEWNEDVKLDGRIIIGLNALSDHYSLRISGNWKRTSQIGGQTLSIITQSPGDSLCTLQMARSGNIFDSLWNYHALTRDNAKDFLKDFRMVDCNTPGSINSDATNQDKLVSIGPSRFYITGAPQGDQEQVRVYLKIADMEVTEKGDAMMALQRSAMSPGSSYPVKYSIFGKQNMEIDFSYTGPSDLKAAGKNPPLDIKLTKFDINNNAYNSAMTFFLTNGMNGNDRVAKLAFKSEANFNESYDTFIQELAHGAIQQIYAGQNQSLLWLHPYMQKYTPDEFYAIIAPSIPNFHSLGRLAQALDLNFQGSPDMTAGTATLSGLEISTSAYGITGNGNAKFEKGHPLPEGQVILTCSNCARLVDDVIAYAIRFQKTMSYFQTPEQLAATTPIDLRLADGVKGFLKALAAPAKDSDPDKTSFIYVIISDGTSGITISGKSLNDAMAMYQEYIGSVLKASSGAAGTPAPAATTPAPAAPLAPTPIPAPATPSAPAPIAAPTSAPAAPTPINSPAPAPVAIAPAPAPVPAAQAPVAPVPAPSAVPAPAP